MWPDGFLNITTRGSRSEPCVYLTFDDGPDPLFTPKLLDILKLHNVTASFFVLGAACERYPALLRRMLAEGHTVGNHSYSHQHPWTISRIAARDEVRRGFDAITHACGRAPRFFRPPYGRLRAAMLKESRRLGLQTVLWSRSAVDWGLCGTPGGIAGRLRKTKPGDILLLHDAPMRKNRPETILQILPGFIGDCARKNLQFATLNKLATRGKI